MAEGHEQRLAGLPEVELANGLVVVEATSHRARRRGLARLESLPSDRALRIPQCPSVHTFGMRFPLDLIWLDKRDRVVRVDRNVPPRRMRMCARARTVIETVGGHADAFLAGGIDPAAAEASH